MSLFDEPAAQLHMTSAFLAALAVVAWPASAQARYDVVDQFSTPSRATYCSLLQDRSHGGNAVECVVPSSGPRQGTWRYYRLLAAGRASVNRRDDWPDAGLVAKIPYGATWAMVGGTPKRGPLRGAINCTSRRTGLTCRNRSGHGFFLSRQRQRRF